MSRARLPYLYMYVYICTCIYIERESLARLWKKEIPPAPRGAPRQGDGMEAIYMCVYV